MSTALWALDLSCRIAAVGALIGALEQWRVREQFRPGCPLSTPAHRASRWRRWVTRRNTLAGLIGAQSATALIVIFLGVQRVWCWAALCLLAVAFVGLRWYRRSGGDGADQMTSIVPLSCRMARDRRRCTGCMWSSNGQPPICRLGTAWGRGRCAGTARRPATGMAARRHHSLGPREPPPTITESMTNSPSYRPPR